MMRIFFFFAVTLGLTGCGSMPSVGPFYVENSSNCTDGSRTALCTAESGNLAFAKDKLDKYATHFTNQANVRAESNFKAGNIGIGASGAGVVSAVAHSREGILASALVGIPTALFMQRYNLPGQTQIYLRGADACECLRMALSGLEAFPALYQRVAPADRLPELQEGYAAYDLVPAQIDSKISAVRRRAVRDLINGVASVDPAMITAAFEKYAVDLKSAQEKINFGVLYRLPATVGGAPLSDEEKAKLKALAIKLKALPAELDKCMVL